MAFVRRAGGFLLSFGLCLSGCGGDRVVTVARDALNHPAIRVDDVGPDRIKPLLYEEQGYVEAKDRLIQMDILRRTARGRLAEIFGAAAEKKDRDIHATGLPRAALKSLAKLRAHHPETMAHLEAFSKGVNRYLTEIEGKVTEERDRYRQWTHDGEFTFASDKFSRWEPVDSVSIAEAMAFYLSSNLPEKLFFGQVASRVIGPEMTPPNVQRYRDLFDWRAIEPEFILAAGGTIASTVKPSPVKRKWASKTPPKGVRIAGAWSPRAFPFPERVKKAPMGSNNWVVSREFAGGKQAFLANDPHLPLRFPTAFYELALGEVRGVNLPGVPGVLVGHNARIAWGLTNQPADVDDVYIDRENEDGTAVFHNRTWKKIEIVRQELKVRQNDGSVASKEVVVRWVPHHGPIISDIIEELKPVAAALSQQMSMKAVLSYRWVGHEGTTEIAAILGVNEATDFSRFKAALDKFEVGAQNVIYADVDGNIGYYSHAKYPIRHYLRALEWPVNIPVVGAGQMDWATDSDGRTLWRESVPELYNPKAGRIVTANNDPYGHTVARDISGVSDYFGSTFATGIRAKRIAEMIDAKKGNVTLKDMQDTQTDHKDLLALHLIKILVDNVTEAEAGDAAGVYRQLKGWSGIASRDEHVPVVADTWFRALASEYFKGFPDLVGSLTGSTVVAKTIFHHLRESFATGAPEARRAAAKQYLILSIQKANQTLPSRDKRWGQVNQLAFHNALSGILPSFPSAAFERDGTWETVDVSAKTEIGEQYGPNFRLIMVLEEGKPITGVNVLAGGNYNALTSNKWVDELYLWVEGKYRDLVPFAN